MTEPRVVGRCSVCGAMVPAVAWRLQEHAYASGEALCPGRETFDLTSQIQPPWIGWIVIIVVVGIMAFALGLTFGAAVGCPM